jgi:hypothetical protein
LVLAARAAEKEEERECKEGALLPPIMLPAKSLMKKTSSLCHNRANQNNKITRIKANKKIKANKIKSKTYKPNIAKHR